jgi:hypothetical protein
VGLNKKSPPVIREAAISLVKLIDKSEHSRRMRNNDNKHNNDVQQADHRLYFVHYVFNCAYHVVQDKVISKYFPNAKYLEIKIA